MQDIGFSEVNVDVAIGVSGCIGSERDLLSITFQCALAGEHFTGNRAGRRRRKCEVPSFYPCVLRKMLPCVLMGQYCCAGRMQPFISVRVVEVPMRIDKVLDWVGANARKSVGNFRPCAGESGIDQEFTVATGEDRDVASSPHQDVYVAT